MRPYRQEESAARAPFAAVAVTCGPPGSLGALRRLDGAPYSMATAGGAPLPVPAGEGHKSGE